MDAREKARPEVGLVRCAACGHVESVGSATGIAPTSEIVEKVCLRDPCPVCGRMTMLLHLHRSMSDREKARDAAIEDWPIKGAPITDTMSAAFDAGARYARRRSLLAARDRDRLIFWLEALKRATGLEHCDNEEQVQVRGSLLHSLTQAADAALLDAGWDARGGEGMTATETLSRLLERAREVIRRGEIRLDADCSPTSPLVQEIDAALAAASSFTADPTGGDDE